MLLKTVYASLIYNKSKMSLCTNISISSSIEVYKTFAGRPPNQSAQNFLFFVRYSNKS